MYLLKSVKSAKTGSAPANKYLHLRKLYIAGILLLSFFAIVNFPKYYDAGLNVENSLMIAFVMLSAIVLFYLERNSSSKGGVHPHEWNSAGGSMHAFSFANYFCPDCGARLWLASAKPDGAVEFCTPGKTLPGTMRFTCPHCLRQFDSEGVRPKQLDTSKLPREKVRDMLGQLKGARAYKLSAEYTRRYLLITVILLLVEIICIRFASARPINLLLPLCVGYFLFVSLINTFTALSTAYYVLDEGAVQKTAWGYRFYGFSATSSLVKLKSDGGAVWALLTGGENLLVSPIVDGWKDMLDELREKAARAGAMVRK